MAWENITLSENVSNLPQCSILGDVDTWVNNAWTSRGYNDSYWNNTYISFTGVTLNNVTGGKVAEKDNNTYITLNKQSSTYILLQFYVNGALANLTQDMLNDANQWKVGYIACINRETQKAFLTLVGQYGSNTVYGYPSGANYLAQINSSYAQDIYEIISNSEYHAYNWVSVPSVSGKNGILSLPVLNSTDGEPVTNGSASDFSSLPSGAIVRTLADPTWNS